MPYNILIFITRKAGISHSDFKKQYETSHMPLLQLYGGKHFPKSHKRNYIHFNDNDQPTIIQGTPAGFDFDAIAEASFEDEAAFQAFLEALTADEEASKILRADEEKFSDREKMKIVVVGDVRETKV
jgi:hypothetical protein